MHGLDVKHGSFDISRFYDATPERVFAAWSSAEAKRRWFVCDDSWVLSEHVLDFRVGGRERLSVGPAGGPAHVFDALYQDIVPSRRIIYSYAMYVGDARISVSLTTIQLRPSAGGTAFLFTEQGAFLDGLASPEEREEGTRVGLDNLARALARGDAS